MKIKFIHAIIVFVIIMAIMFIYGLFFCLPGIPCLNAKSVTVFTEVDAGTLCLWRSVKIKSVLVEPTFCVSEPGSSTGDLIVEVTQAGKVVDVLMKNSGCPTCMPYGCQGAKTSQFKFCLQPGSYKITAKWYSVKDEKDVIV